VKKKYQRGFTLIEILIVLVIISIISTMILLRFDVHSARPRTVDDVVQHLSMVIGYLQEQAVLQPAVLGLKMNVHGYQVMHFSTDGQWQASSGRGPWHAYEYSEQIVLQIEGEGTVLGAPDIILYSSGEITPFTLHITTDENTFRQTLTGLENGEVTVHATQ